MKFYFEKSKCKISDSLKIIKTMINKGLFSSDTAEWATPRDFFEKLDAEFHFDLDPCSTHENAKCERHFTLEDNGLEKNWGGRECSATLRMAEKSASGFGSATRSHASRTPSASCSFLPGPIPHTFTSISITRPTRFVSFVAVFISTNPNKGLRSRQWL